ncbi:MAG: prepilin-type N-terminal cleavage/methylation domain-containing protein [Candidatus Gracilibacteria bacterium]|nr:prepilin-type N-terminal cleavage/methylation domain-containing protein [Candidatus Gracilibacteria bacterium]
MKNKAFTLIELVVGITISMLLMVSVGIFVSTGMSNITLQTKIIDDNKQLSQDILYLQKNILNSKKNIFPIGTATGILLRQNKYFDKGGFSYIGIKEFDEQYCGTGEITKTNHLYISNFIPLDGVTFNTGNNNGDYKSDILNHQILKKISGNWEVVVGRDIYGDKFVEGSFGTGVFLNSPTGIVEIDGKIVFSDTLNDRILYLSGSQVYTLLDEKDGLEEPIGLAYNSTDNILYIANAGKGEILKLSSEIFSTNPELKIENIYKNNISKLEIEINTSETLINIDKDDFNFSDNTDDFVNLENNKINYYFIQNFAGETSQSDCTSIGIIANSSDEVINCTSTGTGKLANFRSASFTDFTINNIKPLLTENKNYYVKIDGEYYPYFTQGDNDIFTKDDNVLEVFEENLFYPTGVSDSGTATIFNTGSLAFTYLRAGFYFFKSNNKSGYKLFG